MEDTRLPKCVVFGKLVGSVGCVGRGRKKSGWGVSWTTSAFGINTDQWATAAQDEEKWRMTTEREAERSMTKWIAAEKPTVGLRHAVVCPKVTGRTKERVAQRRRARADSLVLID